MTRASDAPQLDSPLRARDYVYYDIAISICSTCFRQVNGKIVFQKPEGSENECVFIIKTCPEHGTERVLIADDVDYYRRAREIFLKPSEMPLRFATEVRYGCPYDCGLCTDHEQHSCVTIVEVCDSCNLSCPICFSDSGPHRPLMRPLEQIESMLDAVVRSEGVPDVVQISGGEPTMHPDFFEILDAAKARPIRHLMVNTNGIRIAQDRDFSQRLAEYMPGFELYLQFDSFEKRALQHLRGADLRDVRRQAVERLNELGISTTLVVTLSKGWNDHEVGAIVDWAVEQPAVRGVTFQPIQDAGRVDGFDPARHRLTLTEVRRAVAEQSRHFSIEDLLPVPCHPDCITMAYALKSGNDVLPLSRYIDPQTLIEGGRNTIVFEGDPGLRQGLFNILSTGHSPASGAESLHDLLCCLPKVAVEADIGYQDVFRIIIMQFLDAHSFDVRSVKKSCVHIVSPDDFRMIPLDTYNLFYRDDLEQKRLEPLRQRTGR